MQHDSHHHTGPRDHHQPRGSARGDAIRIGVILIGIFLLTVLCNALFADEMLDNWTLAHHNAEAVQDVQPGA